MALGLLTAAQFRLRLNIAAAALALISHDPRRPPSLDVFQFLFRGLPEALQNSAKHTGAKQLEVQLLHASDGMQLSIHNSGCAFDSDTAMKGGGLGLISYERIKLVNGALSIDSQINPGTSIHARVPCNPGE